MQGSSLRCGNKSWTVRQRSMSRRSMSRRRRLRALSEALETRRLLAVSFGADAYATPESVNDQLLNLNVSLPVTPYLSVSDFDAGRLSVSSQKNVVASTNDGGFFSTQRTFPGQSDGRSSTVYDNLGRLFWVNVNHATRGISIVQLNVGTGAVIAGPFNIDVPAVNVSDDKPYVTVDLNNNNLYVAFTQTDAAGNTKIILTRSANQGSTWTAATTAVIDAGEGFVWGASLSIGADQEVYVAYHSQPGFVNNGTANPNGTSGKVLIAGYTNDLIVRLSKTEAFTAGDADVTYNIQSAATRKIPQTQFYTQGSIQPWVLADPTEPTNVYVVAADDPSDGVGTGSPWSRLYIARSIDNGLTWSAPTEIAPIAGGSFQLFPHASIDRFGDIVVAWMDNRRGLVNVVNDFKLDTMATYSKDGGLTWATAGMMNASDKPYDPPDGASAVAAMIKYAGPPKTTYIGDAVATAEFGGTAYVAWMANNALPVTPQRVEMATFPIFGELSVTGDDAGPTNDTFIVRSMIDNPDKVEILLNNVRQYAGIWGGLESASIDGAAGTDTINVENTVEETPLTLFVGTGATTVNISPVATNLDNIQGEIEIDGTFEEAGPCFLVINDSVNHEDQTYTIDDESFERSDSAVISYTIDGFSNTVVITGSTGDNTYDVTGTPSNFRTTVNTGIGAAEVSVGATGGPLTIAGTNPLGVFSSVFVGNSVPGSGSTLDDINGTLTISNTPSFTDVTIDDSGSSTADDEVTITEAFISGMAPSDIRYSQGNIRSLDITASNGTGDNDFTVLNTPNNGLIVTTTLETASNDVLNIERTTGPMAIFANGGSITLGNDTNGTQDIRGAIDISDDGTAPSLTFDDSVDVIPRTITVAPEAITGVAPSAVTYADLSAITVKAGSAGNTFTVTGTGSFPTTLDTGSGIDTVTVRATTGSLTIHGQSSLDTATIANSANVQGIAGTVSISNSGGSTNLTVDDSSDLTGRTVTLTNTTLSGLAPAAITYANIATFAINGGRGFNTFTVNSTAAGSSVTLNAGNGGGKDAVTIGNGSVQQIAGTINVTATTNVVDLTVNDSGNAAVKTFRMDLTGLTDLAPADIRYVQGSLSSLTVRSGPAANTVNIDQTPTSGVPLLTTLNLGASHDTVYVFRTTGQIIIEGGGATDDVILGNSLNGTQDIRGQVTVQNTLGRAINASRPNDGESNPPGRGFLPAVGAINLSLHDEGDAVARTVTLTTGAITGLAAATVNYRNTVILTMYGGTGGNTFNISGTGASSTTIFTGGGGDTANVRATSGSLMLQGQGGISTITVGNAGLVKNILGNVAIENAGVATLTIDDSADAVARAWAVNRIDASTGYVQYPGIGVISFKTPSLGALNVTGGRANNQFDIFAIPGIATVTTVNAANGGAQPTVNVGGGSTAFLSGILNVTNTNSPMTLNIDDSLNGLGHVVTMTPSSITGLSPLEIRYSGTIQSFNLAAGAGHDIFNIDGAPAVVLPNSTQLLTGPGNDIVNVHSIGAQFLINGQGFANTINVGDSTGVQNIRALLNITNSAPVTALFISDAPDTQAKTATITSGALTGLAPSAIQYAGSLSFLGVTMGSGGNTINVNSTPATAGTIVNTGGGDTVNVRATLGGLVVNCGNGAVAVSVGNVDNTLDTMLGGIQVNGNLAGTTLLTINDQGSTLANRAYLVQNAAAGRTALPAVGYQRITTLTLNCGSGGNSIQVESTATGTSTIVNAGTGSDTVNVGTGGAPPGNSNILGILGPLTVNGQGGVTNTININDQTNAANAGRKYTSKGNGTLGSVERGGDGSNVAIINYTIFQSLKLNPSSTVDVQGTPSGTTVTIAGKNEAGDTINIDSISGPLVVSGFPTVKAGPTDNTLDNIKGTITVDGGKITISDSNNPTLATYQITEASFSRGTAIINFANLTGLDITGGTGNNSYNVLGTPNGFTTNVTTGNANCTINVRATTGEIKITSGGGNNTFNLNSADNRLAPITGKVTMNVGNGSNILTFNDTGNVNESKYIRKGDSFWFNKNPAADPALATWIGKMSVTLRPTKAKNTVEPKELVAPRRGGRGGSGEMFVIDAVGSGPTTVIFDDGDISTAIMEMIGVKDIEVRSGGGLELTHDFAFNDFTVDGGALINDAHLQVNDHFKLMNGGSVMNFGEVEVLGEMQLLGGSFGGGGDLNIPAGAVVDLQSNLSSDGNTTLVNDGTIILNGGAILGPFLVIDNLDGGVIRGNGTLIGEVFNDGVIQPGDDDTAGVMTVDGEFTQSGTGQLNIKIGGNAVGQYDQFNITGAAEFGGTLNLSLINGAEPQEDEEYEIISAGSITGRFATVNGTIIDDPDGNLDADLFFVPIYDDTSLTLFVINLDPG